MPIAGLVAAELDRQGKNRDSADAETSDKQGQSNQFSPLKALGERHHSLIVELIAREAKVDPSDLVDLEMILFDTQKSCVGGLNEELIFSARIDNLEYVVLDLFP